MGLDALFNVYKPSGPTSHDVVARLRRASGVKRIGHAGTLDPLAEGVLLVAAGQATRVIEFLADLGKAYRAEVTFGVETDTYDAEGQVVARTPADHLPAERVAAALRRFRGVVEQRPPAFSAISIGGRRLYDLARRGQPVEAPPRSVEISRLELVQWAPPVAVLDVVCSKGTYIRSLAHDLGRALDTGAFLSKLTRTRAGTFTSQDAIPLPELEQRLRDGTWPAVAVPADQAVAHLPAVHLPAHDAGRLAHGLTVAMAFSAGEAPALGTVARVYDAGGRFIALARAGSGGVAGGGLVWQPAKVFAGGAA